MDLVEFHNEDFRDINAILKLSDTTKDKLIFTVSCVRIVKGVLSRLPVLSETPHTCSTVHNFKDSNTGHVHVYVNVHMYVHVHVRAIQCSSDGSAKMWV